MGWGNPNMMDSISEWINPAITAAWLTLGAICSAHAIMYKRDPKGTAVWMFVCFSLPFIGPWMYWVLGINRVEIRAMDRLKGRRKALAIGNHCPAVDQDQHVRNAIGHLTELRQMSDRIIRFPLVAGNKLLPLHSGEQAYPAMLKAIENAKHTVCLGSYIFDWDPVGRQFTDALCNAAKRGVKVHVLLDGIGAVRAFSRVGRALLRAGAHVAAFFPLRFPLGRLRINLRNHGKLLIVDGHVGFTGGMNISARHLLQSDSPSRVEDLHFNVAGPVVAEMQEAFCEDWFVTTGELLTGDHYFPELTSAGPAICRSIVSGPDEDFEKIHWIILGALASANKSITIATPYFVPSLAILSTMSLAALRGVNVTLILPAKVDMSFMRWAADSYLWQVLERGVRVVHRPPPFIHTKLMIVDERWFLLGSANFDRRSFRLNFEFNIESYDAEMAQELSHWLNRLADQGEEVTLATLDSRPSWQRFRDGVAKLASPYL